LSGDTARQATSPDHPFAVTEAQFHQLSSHFAAPTPDEGFNLVIHDDALDAVPET